LKNKYGPGTGQIWLDDLDCTGYETDLGKCRHSDWGVHNCGHSEDVSITCHIPDYGFTYMLSNL